MLFVNDGAVEICNRRSGYRLWYVVQCLRTPGEGDDLIDRIFERGEDRCRITRDALLNCLDGLMCRRGVVVAATANHQHLIDEALVKRPGRFDRLVTFAAPDREMRRRMLIEYFAANPENRVSTDTIELLADKTAGFSMASVKELFIASASVAFQEQRLAIQSADAVMALEQFVGQYAISGMVRPVSFGK